MSSTPDIRDLHWALHAIGSANMSRIPHLCQLLTALSGQKDKCQNLAFHDVQWEPMQLQKLSSLLDDSSCSIKHLEFQRNRFAAEGLVELTEMLGRNNVIRVIIFSDCQIGSIGAKLLALALTKNDTLEELQVWEDSISSKGAEELSRMIEVNSTLKLLLVLDKDSITATPFISAVLARNRAMELHVWSRPDNNGDTRSKVVEFAPETGTMRIYKLNTSGSQRVACALVRNTTITTLGDKAVVYIAAGLFKNRFLENLQLDGNRFGGVGVEHLLCPLSRFSALQNQANTTLKSLTFGGGKAAIGRDGLLAILRMLETNQTLVQLSICEDSSMNPDDIIKVFKSLARNATLRHLALRNCKGVEGELVLQTIMETLHINPWVEEIDLAGTPLQIGGKVDGIYEKLGQNGSLVPEKDLLDDLPLTKPTCCRILL